jgi:hypothetical protein
MFWMNISVTNAQTFWDSDGVREGVSLRTGSMDFCATLDLYQREDSKEAIASYKQWVIDGRPESPEMLSKQIQQTVGERRNFFIYSFKNKRYESKTFELRAVGEGANIWVEIGEFKPDKVTQSQVDIMLNSLESATAPNSVNPNAGILENNRALFGEAPNVDQSGKVQFLVYEILDENDNSNTGGYFAPINLSLTNANSNKADVLYVNSIWVYNAARNRIKLAVLAHEDQHLIHANYGFLNTFQNEGQSELASIANGYPFRGTAQLALSSELNIPLYRWRDAEFVGLDYNRAALFHEYIQERVGFEKAASITRATSSGRTAYQNALSTDGINFSDFLVDFHTATLLNDTSIEQRFGFSRPGRSNFTVTGFHQLYAPVLMDSEGESTVEYGGAEYVSWSGVKNFSLDVESSVNISQRLVMKHYNSNDYQIVDLNDGNHEFAGEYESVTLISVKNAVSIGSEIDNPPSPYTYSSKWDPLPIQVEDLRYYAEAEFLAELPGDPADANRRHIQRYSMRFEPTNSGSIKQIRFILNSGQNSVQGTGLLKISIHTSMIGAIDSETGQPRQIPGLELYSKTVNFSSIVPGFNALLVDAENWEVENQNSYHIVFEVLEASSDARLEFLIDAGKSKPDAPNYFPENYTPVRSLLYVGGLTNTWLRWGNNNNYLVDIRIVGEYDGPLETPFFTQEPEQVYTAVESLPFEITVDVSGVPNPVFQWRRNGITIPGQSTATLRIEEVTVADAGTYSVRAANFAGSTEQLTFEVIVIPNNIELAQNYPNPFNPSTTIKFTLVSNGQVDLEVFDVLGRRVDMLIRAQDYTAGQYEIQFNAGSLPSGVYLYRLTFSPNNSSGGAFSRTNKMLLVK